MLALRFTTLHLMTAAAPEMKHLMQNPSPVVLLFPFSFFSPDNILTQDPAFLTQSCPTAASSRLSTVVPPQLVSPQSFKFPIRPLPSDAHHSPSCLF